MDKGLKNMDQFFSDQELTIIQQFVDKNIVGEKSLTAKEVYHLVKNQLPRKDIAEARFIPAMSVSVRSGNITGIRGKKRVGYVRIGSSKDTKAPPSLSNAPVEDIDEQEEEVVTAKTLTPISAAPKPIVIKTKEEAAIEASDALSRRRQLNAKKHAHHIWVHRKCYRIMSEWRPLEAIVYAVLKGKQSDSTGDIVFNGKRYDCNTELFESIIVHTLGAYLDGESEPVLDDESGIPVELRIA